MKPRQYSFISWITGVKDDPETSKILFIFLTASMEKIEVEATPWDGRKEYIKKPFEPSDLFDAVASCMKKE